MPGPARRRGGDNAGGRGRRWGQGGSGALGPAKAGPAVAEIGRVPCRDRFSSASRSVRFRVEIGSTAARPGAGAARWAFRCESDGGVVGLAPKCRPRRERGRAPAGVVPHERRTAPRRARPAPRGRTRRRTVVPRSTRSYLKAPLQYDPAPQRTTTRIHVRPREPGYDRPEVTAAGPVGRTTARATAPPHDPPTAPDPTRPITPTPRPRPPTPTASRTARPSDNHHRPPITTGPVANRLTAQPRQTNRSRAGTRPNSSRNRTELDEGERGGGPPAVAGARRPPPSSAHTIPRIALMGVSVK